MFKKANVKVDVCGGGTLDVRHSHRPSIRVDMAIKVGGAGEGQLFGLKI